MKIQTQILMTRSTRTAPSGETLLEALKQMSIEEIATVLNFALRKPTHARNPESGSSNTGTAHGLGLVRKSLWI